MPSKKSSPKPLKDILPSSPVPIKSPGDTLEEDEIITAATYYYVENMNHKAIADEMNCSRQKVAILIAQALKRGLVTIQIMPSTTQNKLKILEDQLRGQFRQLRGVTVVSGENVSESSLENLNSVKGRIGAAAGAYLSKELNDDSVVVVGGGTLVGIAMKAVSKINKNIKIAPFSGFTGSENYTFSPHSNARVLHNATEGIFCWLPAPAFIKNDTNEASLEVELVRKLPFVESTLKMMNREASFFITGVSDVNKNFKALEHAVRSLYSSEGNFEEILQEYKSIWEKKTYITRLVGEVFDENGERVPVPWHNISMNLEIAKDRIRINELDSILLVGDKIERVPGALALIEAELVSTLFIDSVCAEELLKLAKSRPKTAKDE